MSRKLSVANFESAEDIFEFDESFIKKFNEKMDEGYFLEVDIQYSEKLCELHYEIVIIIICYSHKNFKVSNKSWISFEKGSQSH